MSKLTGETGFTFLVPGTFALQRLITNIESTSFWKSRWEADFHSTTLQ